LLEMVMKRAEWRKELGELVRDAMVAPSIIQAIVVQMKINTNAAIWRIK